MIERSVSTATRVPPALLAAFSGDVIVLEGKAPSLFTVNAEDPVRTAIQLMADHYVGALPVMKDDRLAGIVSERDYARKVVLMGRNSLETSVAMIMSAPVIHVGPENTVNDCMQLMTVKRIRHLPVVEDGKLIGGFGASGDGVDQVLLAHGFRPSAWS